MSDSLWPHGLQHARLLCSSAFPGAYSNSCPLSRWCHLILGHPLLLLPSVFLSIRVFYSESALHIRWPKYWSFTFSINPSINIQDWFPLGLTDWSPYSSRDSKESSTAPQFKSINSSVLSFLHNPTLTSTHDCWKNHSFDYTELCWQCLCFLICCLGWS